MKRLKYVALLFALLATAYAVIQFNWPTYSWNQKLTVRVMTPVGEVSGSSVMKIVWKRHFKFLPDVVGATHKKYGEATAVVLPNERYLFALIGSADFIPLRAFAEELLPKRAPAAIESLLPAAREVSRAGEQMRILPRDMYPTFVTFRDRNDPATVERVDPDSLEATFGEGYSIASVQLEILREPVTRGKITTFLSWLSGYPEPRLSQPAGQTTDIPLAQLLSHGDFYQAER